MNLYEKLNRLDDSLVESKRVVKKKKLTESVEDDKKKLFDAAASVKCKLDNDTIEYAMYDVDDFIENELVYCGKLLLSECPDMLFWRYVSDENFGSYCAVYKSDEDFADAYYQISHDRVYDITDEINGDYDDYDDDIDEMLTESTEQYELSTLVKDSINHLVNNLGKDSMTDDFGDDVCADLEDNYDIYVPQNPVKYADWCDAVMSEVSRQLNNKDAQLTEGGYDPYPAGKYGDLIFKILDSCSGDAIITFMNEYSWPFYESGDSMSDVYDKINKYLDTHSGYGLWSDLDKHFN